MTTLSTNLAILDWKDNIKAKTLRNYRYNLDPIKKNKERILAIIFMIISVSILITIMFIGKMLGREMSAQQVLIKEQFPVQKKLSEPENEYNNLTPQELRNFTHSEAIVVALIVIFSAFTIALSLMARKSIHNREATNNPT